VYCLCLGDELVFNIDPYFEYDYITRNNKICNKILNIIYFLVQLSFLSLCATARGELWPPEQSASILLSIEADYVVPEQFNFHGVRFSASRPTPNLKDQAIPLCLAPTP
jgi:hypothetical protein